MRCADYIGGLPLTGFYLGGTACLNPSPISCLFSGVPNDSLFFPFDDNEFDPAVFRIGDFGFSKIFGLPLTVAL